MSSTITSLTIIRPDDWHLHLRDGAVLASVVGDTARQFGRAIIMPNLKPPVTTVALAAAYRDRILAAQEKAGIPQRDFTPLMTLYLTDNTSVQDIEQAAKSGFVHGVKLYPAGATTNSDAGVTDLLGRCSLVLEAMQKAGLPLLVHGEVTDPDIDLFDREAVFVDRVMIPLRRAFPELKVVFEHLTTSEGVQYVRYAEGPVAATLTAHHLLYNRNALFAGGLQPHWYCLPVLKREKHRQALLDAATSGNNRFFLGTDSAPHPRGLKEAACGCAGCYTALHAMELYATAFASVDRLDRLEGFASRHGPAFYGLPENTGTLTLERADFKIPAELPMAGSTVVPLAAGQSLQWKVASTGA
ncbi:dihydroorotase [Allopusillimonas ginsengisoli]|uniref:dihydroorotase n=1 Tax=Allopusillimonas ginsengisoli TaxID=453575 RepID=UPI0010224036|nr:dihydroorotase [Allopusillimonas ginsengisoli]TEA80239.1 dihydroorotase [Allopusillimonas ginsengisoli]